MPVALVAELGSDHYFTAVDGRGSYGFDAEILESNRATSSRFRCSTRAQARVRTAPDLYTTFATVALIRMAGILPVSEQRLKFGLFMASTASVEHKAVWWT